MARGRCHYPHSLKDRYPQIAFDGVAPKVRKCTNQVDKENFQSPTLPPLGGGCLDLYRINFPARHYLGLAGWGCAPVRFRRPGRNASISASENVMSSFFWRVSCAFS